MPKPNERSEEYLVRLVDQGGHLRNYRQTVKDAKTPAAAGATALAECWKAEQERLKPTTPQMHGWTEAQVSIPDRSGHWKFQVKWRGGAPRLVP